MLTQFAEVNAAKKSKKVWMEKFGEWKHAHRVHNGEEGGTATWEVNVLEPGYYNVDLSYIGQGQVVWKVKIEGGDQLQNQQNSSHNFQQFPIGWIEFPEPEKYKVSVSCIEGDMEAAGLKSIHFRKIDL